MHCPYCREGNCRVLDTSSVEDAVRRRRGCVKCGQRFTTYERLAPVGLFVVKRNGRREPFNREKLHRSVCAACAKRPISRERIEEEMEKLKLIEPSSPEFNVSRSYLDWLTVLPWGVFTKDSYDISKASRILNRDLPLEIDIELLHLIPHRHSRHTK